MNAINIVLVEPCQLVNLIKRGDKEKKKQTKNTNSILEDISRAIIKEAKIPKIPSESAETKMAFPVDTPKTRPKEGIKTKKPEA